MTWREKMDQGLERALSGFLTEPSNQEATNAVYNALAVMMEVECRRLVAANMKLAVVNGNAQVTLNGQLAKVLSDLFTVDDDGRFAGPVDVNIPGWKPPTEAEIITLTRPYLDPKTKRPTRGRPQ